MTLRHMTIYCAVFEECNITHAAKKLYLAQPAVSAAVREIENHYGVKCFDRLGNRLSPTASGRQLYGFASHIVDLFGKVEDEMANGAGKKLRVGASITVGGRYMPEIAASFKVSHPDVDVFVSVENSADIERAIMRNDLDFAFIEGVVHEGAIVSEVYARDEIVMTAAPAHKIFTLEQPVPASELCGERFLLREVGSGTRELFEAAMTALSLKFNVAWESTSTGALLNAAEAGCGIAVTPLELASDRIESGRLKKITAREIDLRRSYYFIRHKNKYLPRTAKEFIAAAAGVEVSDM